jgi:uncharacterized protein (AIM24 family)
VRARTTLTAAAMAVATGAALMATAPVAAGAATAPSVSVTPHKHLSNGDKVTVRAGGFTNAPAGMATAAECSHAALKSKSINDCDVQSATPVPVNANGNGKATFTVVSGRSYSDMNGGKCGGRHSCIIVVVDTPFGTTQQAAAAISFKKPTHTTVTSKKTAHTGKKFTFKIKTTHKGAGKLTGKVTLKANGKKIAKVKVRRSGKEKVKVTFTKTGKYKIKAHYSGNKRFSGSTGKEKIRVKS